MWKTMSSPMKSASASGPIGWLAPFCMAASMSAIEPSARSRQTIASTMYGTRSRFTM